MSLSITWVAMKTATVSTTAPTAVMIGENDGTAADAACQVSMATAGCKHESHVACMRGGGWILGAPFEHNSGRGRDQGRDVSPTHTREMDGARTWMAWVPAMTSAPSREAGVLVARILTGAFKARLEAGAEARRHRRRPETEGCLHVRARVQIFIF